MKDSKSDIIEYSIFILIFAAIAVFTIIIYNKLYPVEEELEDLKAEPIQEEIFTEEVVIVDEAPLEVKEIIPSDDDIIAMVVMAEAGNQEMLGKVAVATTILNRCDYYNLTVETIVTAEGQYVYPYYGIVSEDCYRAVEIARACRDLFPEDMMYFRTFKYHNFGEPYIQIQDHFFSVKGD